MRKQALQNLIVGLVTLAILAYGAYFVYQTSEESTILLNAITIKTEFPYAAGIKRYAPVRVHGISVGKVEKIFFSDKPGEDLVFVEMSMKEDFAERVAISNPDPEAPAVDPEQIYSHIYISSEGLLGDNLIEIYAGDPTKAPQKLEHDLRAKAEALVKEQFEQQKRALQEAGQDVSTLEWNPAEHAGEIEEVKERLKKEWNWEAIKQGHITDGYKLRAKPGGGGLAALGDSLSPVINQLEGLLKDARTEPGLVHTLIYDEKGKELMGNLNETVAHVKDILAEVKTGQGNLHEVIYGNDIKKVLADLSAISGKLNRAMSDVEKAVGSVEGVVADVNTVIADVKEKDLVGNLKGTLANVEDITKKIKEGEGTLGALVTDKSVYEDLQSILGGAARSEVVRQAVRYAKSRDKGEEKKEK